MKNIDSNVKKYFFDYNSYCCTINLFIALLDETLNKMIKIIGAGKILSLSFL